MVGGHCQPIMRAASLIEGLDRDFNDVGVRSFVLTGGKMARPKRKREVRRAVIKLTHYPIWNQLHVGEFRS